MNGGGRKRSWARWGWLVTTLALGALVIGSAWSNLMSVRIAAADLIRGEAQIFRDVVMTTNRPTRDGDRLDLDSLVKTQREAGLRFAGWVGESGALFERGGEPAPDAIKGPDAVSDAQLERLGSRVRAYFPPPGPPEVRESTGRTSRASARDRRSAEPLRPDSIESPTRRRPMMIVVEFEPVVADDMVARASRALFIAAVVTGVLMAAAIVLWRMSQRIETHERQVAEQRRLMALGEMSAVMAHEIRNPLASLKGHAQLLVERLVRDVETRRKAERVVEEATRLEALTSDLLDFARSGPMDLRPVDPAALLRGSAAEVSPAVEVVDEAAPDRWLLDERRFRQAVLVNLLRNAVQAAPAERPPEAGVGMENGSLVFTVRDFGPGLPTGTEARIFDPFFTTRTAGTGLGLAVARRIVESHGGRIEAVNAPGGGALFRVVLPRREG